MPASTTPDWNAVRPSAASTTTVGPSPCEGPIELCQLVANDASETQDASAIRTNLIRRDQELARHGGLMSRDASHLESIDQGSSKSHKSSRYLSSLVQRGVGPRDTIEFTLDDGFTIPEASPTDCREASEDFVVLPNSSSATLRQGHVSIVASTRDLDHSGDAQELSSEESSADASSRPPSEPTTSPRRLTGCSITSSRLDRVLGRDNDFNIRRGSHAWEDQSALGVWLIAQSMRSRDCSLLLAGDADTDQLEHRDPCLDFGGIDSIIDIPEDHAPEPTDRKLTCNASSHYASMLPSFQPSPAGSETKKYSLSPEDLEHLELSPLECCALRDFGVSEGHSSSYATAEEDETSDASFKDATLLCQAPRSRRGPDSKSVTHSEPNSFHQREAELRSVEQRFGQAVSRKPADMPLRSRFREEFTTIRRPARTSFIRRIQHSLPRLSRPGSDAPSETRHFSASTSPEISSIRRGVQAAFTEVSAGASIIPRPQVVRHWRNERRRTSLGGLMAIGKDGYQSEGVSSESWTKYDQGGL
ncbi:glutathione-dependent formaldehyde-activating enzyme [Ophiocordyceps camponoti-floridani]|uniref:Glutathione-dependent formaldehyde-activating enzyme n=1 Tax=Ophiocordyceps camponoti-floridani TaxID=2030778 RepID=A0A8H4Q421_9HYPO|nr:glutathione-dependent formaldehyde-activating enzyme [Ophiocordyceps camponoti-floridani]